MASVFGSYGVFNGSNAYLTTNDHADWNLGSGSFTVDYRLCFNVLPSSGSYMYIANQRYTDGVEAVHFLVYNNAGQYQIWTRSVTGGAENFSIKRDANFYVGHWCHIAHVRNGNTHYIFQNGIQLGATASSSESFPDAAAALDIGRNSGGSLYLNGCLDEFRWSKGVARWTSTFSPPTEPYTADADTKLLIHFDGDVVDGETTPKSITNNNVTFLAYKDTILTTNKGWI